LSGVRLSGVRLKPDTTYVAMYVATSTRAAMYLSEAGVF